MNKKYLKWLIVFVPFTLIADGYQALSERYQLDNKILELWSQSKVSIERSIKTLDDSPTELYFISSDTYNILNYAFEKDNTLLIDELLKLYMKTLPYVKEDSRYAIYNLNEKDEKTEKKLKEYILIWTNQEGDEELIPSAQFLFVISFAFNKIATTPKERRTSTMNSFIDDFSPILSSHYRRWIIGVEEINGKGVKFGSFSRRGWGCKDKQGEYIYARTLNQIITELGDKSYEGASFCNVIADPSMLIVSGLGYYLGGVYENEKLHKVREKEKLEDFFIRSIAVISQEFKIVKNINSNSRRISTLAFQEGAWFGHPDYGYSGYIGSNFPSIKNKKIVKNIGLDVAHGSRVIYLLEMLVANQKKFNITFPTFDDMKMFTYGFIYNVFNQDFQKPLFKNYMNGSNGWFRVNYESREGYGYAPFKLGSAGALLGGYPRLAKYNSELETIFGSMIEKFNSNQIEDRNFMNEFYEKAVWSEGEEREPYHFFAETLDPKSSLYLLNFYSSII